MALDPAQYPDLVLSYRLSAALLAAMELGIPDALTPRPLPVDELAAALSCDEETLLRLVRVLVAAGALEMTGDLIGHTSYSRRMCSDSENPSPDMILGWHGLAETYRCFGALADTVRTGAPPFARLYGEDFHDYLGSHPDRGKLYSRANESTTDAFDAAVAAFPFGDYETIVDVGGGRGSFLRAICSANPSVRGILFDLPNVVDGVAEELASQGLAPRIEVIQGDAASQPLPVADAYLFSTVLRCFTDEMCHRVLTNASSSSPASLIIFDFLMEDDPDLRFAMADLQNLATYGGKDRTRAEWDRVLARAGYRIARIESIPGDALPIIVAQPSGS